jgi:hypothetical protein
MSGCGMTISNGAHDNALGFVLQHTISFRFSEGNALIISTGCSQKLSVSLSVLLTSRACAENTVCNAPISFYSLDLRYVMTGETFILPFYSISFPFLPKMPPSASAVTAPPPTLNNLDPHQRTRLLRSTRKLGALLGTTPYLLEHTTSSSRPQPSFPASPSARISPIGTRREGPPLGFSRFSFPSPHVHSAHPQLGRDDGYVLVHRAHSPSFIEKPFSSFESEFTPDILREREDSSFNDKPRLLLKKNSVSKESREREKSGSQTKDRPKDDKPKKETTPTVSHPLVLSLLSVPVSQFDARIQGPSASSPSSNPARSRGPNRDAPLPSPTFAPNGQTLTLPATPTTPNTPTPLTPLSATYYSNQSDGSERERERQRERQRDVRRKKIAKLARTLGENVPPELVFPTTSVEMKKEQSPKTHQGRDTNKLMPRSGSTSSSAKSQARFQATRASIPSAECDSSQSKHRSPPASAPPIVIIGPPPPPGARKKRRSPTSSQNQNGQSEVHACAGLVIPPPPSVPAPLPPSRLVEQCRLEREKSMKNLNQAQLAPASALDEIETYGHRPRSLSLGSGIDMLDMYWEEEMEIEDGKGGSWTIGEVNEADPPALTNPFAYSTAINPDHNQIQFPTLLSPTIPSYRTHRIVQSLPSPHDVCFPSSPNRPTTFIASDATFSLSPPPLRRKSSKNKSKAAPSSKVEGKKSHGSKSRSLGGPLEVGIQRSVELDDGTRLRSGTPQSSEGGHTSRPLPSPPECGSRKEHEWSGEWNRRNMDEVVKALRGLKAR